MVAPVIPIMTSNAYDNSGIQITASSHTDETEPYYALRNSVGIGWESLPSTEGHWFQIQSQYPLDIYKFAISGNIDSYVIKGSDNSTSWMTIFISDEPVRGDILYKSLTSPSSWKYIKIEITNNDGKTGAGIKYLQFFA